MARLLSHAYYEQDRDVDDAGLTAILSATDTELLTRRNIGPAALADFRAVWPKPSPRRHA